MTIILPDPKGLANHISYQSDKSVRTIRRYLGVLFRLSELDSDVPFNHIERLRRVVQREFVRRKRHHINGARSR
jgi:hypothetical protein